MRRCQMTGSRVRLLASVFVVCTCIGLAVYGLSRWANAGGQNSEEYLPAHLLPYPGSTLQEIELWPSDSEGTVSVLLMFATDDPEEKVIDHYTELLKPYGTLRRFRPDIRPRMDYHRWFFIYVRRPGTEIPCVQIGRAAKSDTNLDGFPVRADKPREEETKIICSVTRALPE